MNGPKDQATIDRAVAVGAKVTMDSTRELDMVRRAARRSDRIALVRPRMRPDLTSLTEASDWLEEEVPVHRVAQIYKAGIPREDLFALGRELLDAPEIRVTGIHVHVGRHRSEPDYWRRVAAEIAGAILALRDAWGGFTPGEIDVGGGLPLGRDPFGRAIARQAARELPAASIDGLAGAIAGSLRAELLRARFPVDGVALEVEPGRSLRTFYERWMEMASERGWLRLLGASLRYFYRPEAARGWVETDTTENFLPDGLLEHNRWSIVVANKADHRPAIRADLVGCSCNPDRIVPEADLPEMEEGDLIAILDTGAYQDALSSNFNLLTRPATVLVTGDRSEIVKRRETIDDVLARDVLPVRLATSAERAEAFTSDPGRPSGVDASVRGIERGP